jgi:hypothetical protein
MEHVTSFYKGLFGLQPSSTTRLGDNFWADHHSLSLDQKNTLISSFHEEEVKKAIVEMRVDSSPGPNRFGVHFFKSCWPIIEGDYMAMMSDFHRGDLDIKRLNYGVIILVTKTKVANNIKQYHPICLLNVDYKGVTKVLTNRLTSMAKDVIGENPTSFIKGRNILEGVLILHEVVHE